MESVKYYKLRMVLGYLYVAVIIYTSLAPKPYVAEFDPTRHNVLSHFIAYFIMMLWFARLYPCKKYPYLAAIFISLGIVLEFLQRTISTRDLETVDILMNATGVLFAWAISKFCLSPVISR